MYFCFRWLRFNALVKLSNGELRFIETDVATNVFSGQTPIEVMVNNLEDKVLVYSAEESLVNESYVQESKTQKNVLQLRQEVVAKYNNI